MTNWMTETYNKNSAAHTYYFGFVLAGLLYVVAGMTFAELSAYFRPIAPPPQKAVLLKSASAPTPLTSRHSFRWLPSSEMPTC